MTSKLFKFQQIGVIGLGTGTLSTYLNGRQVMDFFELDPDIYKLAKKYFTFLNNAAGKINYFFGDARLSLDKIPQEHYDLFVVDAFSGDSVPSHLLTLEAIEKIHKRLKKDGIILYHISNRYLRLGPVVAKGGHSLGAYVCYKHGEKTNLSTASTWVAVTWQEGNYKKLISDLQWIVPDPKQMSRIQPWTDQYTNILSVLLLDDIIDSIRFFRPFSW